MSASLQKAQRLPLHSPKKREQPPAVFDNISLSLSDLPNIEKAKVARLVNRLVSLAKEHEDLLKVISAERSQRARDIDAVHNIYKEQIEIIDQKCSQLNTSLKASENKRRVAINLLKLYQSKTIELVDQNSSNLKAVHHLQTKLDFSKDDNRSSSHELLIHHFSFLTQH